MRREAKALELAATPSPGGRDHSFGRQAALSRITDGRLTPPPTRQHTVAERRAPGGAARDFQWPLWCALVNPAPDFPREAQRRGNLRSFPMPGFLGASERRKYVRGPGAAGKFGSGLRSASKISYRVLPPGVSFVFPTLSSPAQA